MRLIQIHQGDTLSVDYPLPPMPCDYECQVALRDGAGLELTTFAVGPSYAGDTGPLQLLVEGSETQDWPDGVYYLEAVIAPRVTEGSSWENVEATEPVRIVDKLDVRPGVYFGGLA